MKIYLIRHGETTGDVEDRFGGDYDDFLTERGEAQAKELAEKLNAKGIQLILHSPRIRARQVAEILGTELKVPLAEFDNLRERNLYGILTGLTKAEAAIRHPEHIAHLKSKGNHSKLPSSEHYPDFKKRIESLFSEIAKRKESCIAVVTHGGVIRAFMREIIKAGELTQVSDCGFVVLECKDCRYQVTGLDGVELASTF